MVFAVSYEWADEVAELSGEFRVTASRPWRKHDMALYIRNLREVSVLSQRPYYEIESELKRIDEYTYPWVYPISEQIVLPFITIINYTAHLELCRDQLIWAAQLARGQTATDPPVDVLTGHPLQSWQAPDGGWVVWSVRAEMNTPDIRDREGKVWRLGTQLLPPSLRPFADELIQAEADEFGP